MEKHRVCQLRHLNTHDGRESRDLGMKARIGALRTGDGSEKPARKTDKRPNGHWVLGRSYRDWGQRKTGHRMVQLVISHRSCDEPM